MIYNLQSYASRYCKDFILLFSTMPAIKKDVRLIALRPQNRGIAKRLNKMNGEETIFPRRDIYIGSAQNAHNLHIHRMSIDCSSPLFKILAKFLSWT